MSTRRVLVTGGCGFAGHHLVEHLLVNTDWQLVVIDGLSYAGRLDRLTDVDVFDPDRVHVVWHDLRAPIRPALDKIIGEIDVVLHLAADTHVDRSIEDPVPFVTNNYLATLNLLEWAKHRYLTHFVQISTDEVYGPAPAGIAHVEWSPIVPSNPYSASKAAQEALCIAWWRTWSVPVVITNTMNLFGERQHPEKYIPKVISSVMRGRTVPVHGRWRGDTSWEASSRHWLHARNHAAALLWVVDHTLPARYAEGALVPDRWNVAGDELNVEEVAEFIANMIGRELFVDRVEFHSSRPGHDLRYALDNAKITAAGFTLPVPTLESLERTVKWTLEHQEWLT